MSTKPVGRRIIKTKQEHTDAIRSLAGKLADVKQSRTEREGRGSVTPRAANTTTQKFQERSQTRPQPKRGGNSRLDLGRTQKPRIVSLGRSPEASASIDGGTVGVASVYTEEKPKMPKEIKYSSKSWPGHEGIVYAGSELWNPAMGLAGTSTQLFSALEIAPSTLTGTRVSIEAQNWQYFRFRKFALEFISSLPTTQAGQLALGYYHDPDQNLFLGSGMLRKIESLDTTVTFNAWEHAIADVKWGEDCPWLYTEMQGEPRFDDQGVIFFGATTNPNLGSAGAVAPLGMLKIHYEIEFCEPIIDTSSMVPEQRQISLATPVTGASAAVTLTGAPISALAATFPNTRVYSVIVDSWSSVGTIISQTAYQSAQGAFQPIPGNRFFGVISGTNVMQIYGTIPTSFNAGDPLVAGAAGMSAGTGIFCFSPAATEING